MLKKLFTFISGLTVFLVVQAQSWPQPQTAEFKLAIELSKCVSARHNSINPACLKTNFFPLLGLRANDRVIRGKFYNNTEARGLSLTVEKTSLSGNTTALFDISIGLERKITTHFFFGAMVHIPYAFIDGVVYGTAPNKDKDLVSVYELAIGDFLVGDKDLRVVSSLDGKFTGSNMPAPIGIRGLSDVINSGKKISNILEERMDAVEMAGLGGIEYQMNAKRRADAFSAIPSIAAIPEIEF